MSNNEWAKVIQAQVTANLMHERLEKELAADSKNAYRQSLDWQLRRKHAQANHHLEHKRFENEVLNQRNAALRAWETQQAAENRKQQQALAANYDSQITYKRQLAQRHKLADRTADQQRLQAAAQSLQQEEHSTQARRNQLSYDAQFLRKQASARRDKTLQQQAWEKRKEEETVRNQIDQASLRQKQLEEFKAQIYQRTATKMQVFAPVLDQAQQRDMQQTAAVHRWTQEHEQAWTRKAELEAQMKRNAQEEMTRTLARQLQAKAARQHVQQTALLEEREVINRSLRQFSEHQRLQRLQQDKDKEAYRSALSHQMLQQSQARQDSQRMSPRERVFYKDVLESPPKPKAFPAVPGQTVQTPRNPRCFAQLPRNFSLGASYSSPNSGKLSFDLTKHDPILNPLSSKPTPVGKGKGLALLYPDNRRSARWAN